MSIELIVFLSLLGLGLIFALLSKTFSYGKKTRIISSGSGTSTASSAAPAKKSWWKKSSGKWGEFFGFIFKFVILVVVVAVLQFFWEKYVDSSGTSYTTITWSRTPAAPVENPVPKNHIYNFSDSLECPDGRCLVRLGCDEFCWGTEPIGGDVVLEVRRDNGFELVHMDRLADGNMSAGFIDSDPRIYYLRAATKEESTSDSLATGVNVYWYQTGYH
ncbi:MAG: hypothetical protein KBD52_02590 [Candidatus Pacebacteria bacterium]|nr:hypothetical protein [Candidatus Paceibacterota bacterium]